MTTKQVNMNRNPDGKGGFAYNPQNRSNGRWKKENTISYQYRRFLNMNPDELKNFNNTPNNERTVAMDIAYSQVLQSRKSLAHTKEITDRTEGKASQAVDITTGGQPFNIIVEKEYAKPRFRTDTEDTESDGMAGNSSQ